MPDSTRLERETTNEQPLVSVVIPHYLGDVVSRCLHSIARAPSAASFEVIVVDDQPRDDGSIARATSSFPELRVTKTHGGHGFGAACNAGIRAARGKYLAILNNDVEVAPGWLDALVSAAEADPKIGILQAKIRSLRNHGQFDYSGAAGGMIDWLGFPFAVGRVFDEIEEDRGQHDAPRDIFWAVGSAFLIRRSCLELAGLFDERFYMHMEEIDLAWRVQLAGFRVVSCPAAVAHHWNGFSLRQGCFRKAFLNHRNNLVLLLKNLPAGRLAIVMPARIGLELATIVYGLLRRDWRHPLAAILGMLWVLCHVGQVLRRRQEARQARRVPDKVVLQRMHPRSIVVDHFLGGMTAAAIAGSAATARRPVVPSRSRSVAPSRVQPTGLLVRRGRVAVVFLLALLGPPVTHLHAQETTRARLGQDRSSPTGCRPTASSSSSSSRDAEVNTGKTFVYSDTAADVRQEQDRQDARARPRSQPTPQQIFSFFQGILISQNLAITPLGDDKNGIYLIETVDQPRQLKQRAPFVHESSLKDYRHEIGTVIMTSIQLKHIKVDSVRNAVRPDPHEPERRVHDGRARRRTR